MYPNHLFKNLKHTFILLIGIFIYGSPDLLLAENYQYQYISLQNDDSSFSTTGINDKNEISLDFFKCNPDCTSEVVIYKNGKINSLGSGSSSIISKDSLNNKSVVGGYIKNELGASLPALYSKNGIKVIPLLTNTKCNECIAYLNDNNSAIIEYNDVNYNINNAAGFYNNGILKPLKFGQNINSYFYNINNNNMVSANNLLPSYKNIAFKFEIKSNKLTWLNPLSPDLESKAYDINNTGNVLGTSYIDGGIQHIGVWDTRSKFKTYFSLGTTEYPNKASSLIFNDKNLIATSSSEKEAAYLIPKPNVILKIKNLIVNPPNNFNLGFITINGINNNGDMIGDRYANQYFQIDSFLLKRIYTHKN